MRPEASRAHPLVLRAFKRKWSINDAKRATLFGDTVLQLTLTEAADMMPRCFPAFLGALAGLVLSIAGASAHPHVWVTVSSELIYAPDGAVTGVRHAWAFDDMFSVFATQGIESKE